MANKPVPGSPGGTEKYNAQCSSAYNQWKKAQAIDPETTPDFRGFAVSIGMDGETANACQKWASELGG